MAFIRRLVTVAAVSGGVLLQACAGHPTYEPALRVKWADDAGSVTVSQTAVTDWDDVASELQPSFKMDSATAFAAAIPTTQSFDERLADILSANVQLGLPTTTSTRTRREGFRTDEGEDIPASDEFTRTRTTGTAPSATQLTPATAAALAALTSGTLGDDPMLRYLAATALQQEVALLNRYVRDRVRWPGSQAFVVRLQLTVMPNGRSMPYDVETDITLHAEDEQSRARLALASQTPDSLIGTEPNLSAPDAQTAIGNRASNCAVGSHDSLQVLPMIVTDNLEGLRAARTTDNVRQLALALVGTAGNVGAGGQFGRTIEALRRAEGRDVNSLLTVAKLSDDTVRVRLGAVQSPRFGYVTIPRNHHISLVVIYRPCLSRHQRGYEDQGSRILTAVTRTTFRDAQSGRALEYENATQRLSRVIGGIQNRFVGQFNYLELARMYQWVSRQDRRRFFDYVVGQHLQASMCSPGFVARLFNIFEPAYGSRSDDYSAFAEPQDHPLDQSQASGGPDARCLTLARIRYEAVAAPLWTELQSVRVPGQFAFTNIPVTLRRRSPLLPPRQVALINYSDAESTVALSQGRDLAGLHNLQMTLRNGSEEPIQATETSVSANGRTITGKFPPLARFGVAAPSGQTTPSESPRTYELEVRLPRSGSGPSPCPRSALSAPAPEGQSRSQQSGTSGDQGSSQPYGVGRVEGDDCVVLYRARLHNAAAPTPSSAYVVATSASGIVANPVTGRGRLIVAVLPRSASGPAAEVPATLNLAVEGAQLSGMQLRNGTPVAPASHLWKLTAAGELILDLENLIPNTIVKVNLREGGTVVSTVSLSVVAAAAPRSD